MSQSFIDWDKLSFAFNPAKEMFINLCKEGCAWDKGEYRPFGSIAVSPAACVLNYGQGLFEGLKCRRSADGRLLLFRPLDNGKRLANGARQMCMPEYPPEKFVEAVAGIVRRNADYVPPFGKGSLYIRPCLWGTGAILGVGAAPEYTFMIYASPVGPYFKTGFKPGRFLCVRDFHRSAPRGTGAVKCIGNYAGTILPSKHVKARGFNDCIYLDAREERFIEEVGSANFFCVKGKALMTPALGSILPGITRESVMTLAREKLGMEVLEMNISVEDALSADEAFCTGTAAVISPIGTLVADDREVNYQKGEVGHVTKKIYDLLTGIQNGEVKDEWGWVVAVDV
jgi:branched-chain amino acid aminotransferase